MKNTTDTHNTICLVFAGIVTQTVSAVLKIILSHTLGECGLSVYKTAILVYAAFSSVVVSGFSVPVSGYIASLDITDEKNKIQSCISYSRRLLFLISIIAALTMTLLSGFLSASLKEPDARLPIILLAPSVVFVALGTVYKSFFQGICRHTPAATAQIVEMLMKLGLTLTLALFPAGSPICAATISVTVSEGFATFILFRFYRHHMMSENAAEKFYDKTSVIRLALPLMLTSFILNLFDLPEISILKNTLLSVSFSSEQLNLFLNKFRGNEDVFRNLIKYRHFSISEVSWLFGAYSGYALTLIQIPIGILSPLQITLFPKAVYAYSHNDTDSLILLLSKKIKAVVFFTVPYCILLFLFPKTILYFVFKNTASYVFIPYIVILLPLLLISGLVNTVIFAAKRIFVPFFISISGTILYILSVLILVRMPELNLFGGAISDIIRVVFELSLSLIYINKRLKIKTNILKSVFEGICYSFIFSAFLLIFYCPLFAVFKSSGIAVLLDFILSFGIYALTCLL